MCGDLSKCNSCSKKDKTSLYQIVLGTLAIGGGIVYYKNSSYYALAILVVSLILLMYIFYTDWASVSRMPNTVFNIPTYKQPCTNKKLESRFTF
jgi:hypothetical protein